MRKTFIKSSLLLTALFACGITMATSCSGCSSDNQKEGTEETTDGDESAEGGIDQEAGVEVKPLAINEGEFHHTYLVADQNDERHIYKGTVDKTNCFFVISKKEFRLYVYEAAGGDTSLVASFPVCYASKPEPKQSDGDGLTPECTMANPFHIMGIDDASTWPFDFDDGRGEVKAFGDYFMRLDLSESYPDHPDFAKKHSSIGIHGSTNNERSVPGRDSHGCIRLRDADLVKLHDTYAHVGTMVVIKGADEGKLPFEIAAQKKLGGRYIAPTPGNPYLNGSAPAPAENNTVSESDFDETAENETEEAPAEVAPKAETPKQSETKSGKTAVVKGTSVCIRKGPGTDYPTVKNADGGNAHVNDGKQLKYLGETRNGFHKVSFRNEDCWISVDYADIK